MDSSAPKPRPPKDRSKLRTGFTTGACAAAAARSAALSELDGLARISVDTTLPNGDLQTFPLVRSERGPGGRGWIAAVKKFAGDDPDCTDGAHLTAWVELSRDPGIRIVAGPGVATVTKPGLGLQLGEPAITDVPRRNLTELVESVLAGTEWCGARVELSVPGGEAMARETLNSRLGLIGGISILGTTGIVKPYSTAAYRASVVHAIDLARAVGQDTVVLTTGGRSERYAMALCPGLGEEAFIQVGDFIGTGLSHARRVGLERCVIVGMIGKLAKMADGRMMTHAAGSKVNMPLLARLAEEVGAPSTLVAELAAANTGRHVMELAQAAGLDGFFDRVCAAVADETRAHVTKVRGPRPAPHIEVALVDFEGELLGVFPPGSFRSRTTPCPRTQERSNDAIEPQ